MAYIMIIASTVAGVGIFVFERIVPFEHVPQQEPPPGIVGPPQAPLWQSVLIVIALTLLAAWLVSLPENFGGEQDE